MRSAEVLPVVIISISIVPVCWWEGRVERLNTNGECQVVESGQTIHRKGRRYAPLLQSLNTKNIVLRKRGVGKVAYSQLGPYTYLGICRGPLGGDIHQTNRFLDIALFHTVAQAHSCTRLTEANQGLKLTRRGGDDPFGCTTLPVSCTPHVYIALHQLFACFGGDHRLDMLLYGGGGSRSREWVRGQRGRQRDDRRFERGDAYQALLSTPSCNTLTFA